MLVEYKGKKYLLDFEYEKPDRNRTEVIKDSLGREHVIQLDNARQRHRNKYRRTKCTIRCVTSEKPFEAEVIADGIATCGPCDQFNKEFGRKLSLRRATDAYRVGWAADRSQFRAAVWRAYRDRKPASEEEIRKVQKQLAQLKNDPDLVLTSAPHLLTEEDIQKLGEVPNDPGLTLETNSVVRIPDLPGPDDEPETQQPSATKFSTMP